MADTITSVRVKARLSYAKVHTPEKNDEGVDKYSVALIVDKADKASIKAIEDVVNAMVADYKAGHKGKLPANFKLPQRDGDVEKEDDPNYKNAIWLNASSKNKPALFWKIKGEVLPIPADQAEDAIYSGCYASVKINFFQFETKGNIGIGVGLQGICKLRDGERLSGGGASADDFADVDDTEFESVEDDDLMG